MNELFLGLAPIVATGITQIAKKYGWNPHYILIALSLLGGLVYWAYFLLPEQNQAWIAFAAGQIAVGSTGIYKLLLKFYPELSQSGNASN